MKVSTIFLVCIFGCMAQSADAQFFQFSQYNFTTQRVNPAMVSSSNEASVSMDYRNQSTGADFNLSSTVLSAVYPFLSRTTGKRWSGIGISVMDDRSGQAGIFDTQEASLSYAITIHLDRGQTLSLGARGLFIQRNVNLNGLYTGSQYIPDRGFDGSMGTGENMGMLKSNFFTFSTGLYWQQTDKEDNRLAYWGISIFDFNKPDDSFQGVETSLRSTGVFTAGVRIYEKGNLSVYPEVLLMRGTGNTTVNAGAITRYELREPNKAPAHVDLITKYVIGRSGILGLQLHKENFSIGFSYDFPMFYRNAGNLGAFEVAVALKRLVDPRLKNKKKPVVRKNTPTPKTTPNKTAVKKAPVQTTVADSIKTNSSAKPTLTQTLQAKQDSVLAKAAAGNISHEPLVLEKVTLHFNFEFNSSDLDEASEKYLDDLSQALNENALLKVKLTGHTDNVGADAFNIKLSVFRAKSIKDHLVRRGVDPGRIVTEGKGMREPLNENSTADQRAKNRRVELTILYSNE